MFSIPIRRIIVLMLIAFISFSFSAQKSRPSATVKFLIGKVQIQSSGKTAWRTARMRQRVFSGDRIKTFLNSRIELSMPDGSVIKVNENTVFDVKEIKTKSSDNEDRMSFTLWAGDIWAKFKKVISTRQVREIESPSAVVAIRGTELELNVDQNQTTTVRVYEGRVAVRSKTVPGEVLVGSNQQSVVEKGKPPTPPKPTSKTQGEEEPEQPATTGTNLILQLNVAKYQYTDPAILAAGIPVQGRTVPGATVTANGVPLSVRPDGRFEGRLPVSEGLNEFRFVAQKDDQKKAKTLRVLVNTKPPQIRLSKPIVAGFYNRRDYSLSGAVFDPTPRDRVKVFINDELVTEVPGSGSFNRTIILNEGKNIIKVRAVDLSKNQTEVADRLFLDTVKPILTITEPAQKTYVRFEPPRPPSGNYSFSREKFTQTVRGLIIDPKPSSGIKRITLNGKEIRPNADGTFEVEIVLKRGKLGKPSETRLSFVVEDMAGNITRDNSHLIIIR